MIYSLVAPGPIEDVEEIRVLEWHGGPGRVFASGELIVELETHKALVEVRAGQPGVLRQIITVAGGWRRIGEALAILSDDPEETVAGEASGLEAWPVEFEIS